MTMAKRGDVIYPSSDRYRQPIMLIIITARNIRSCFSERSSGADAGFWWWGGSLGSGAPGVPEWGTPPTQRVCGDGTL